MSVIPKDLLGSVECPACGAPDYSCGHTYVGTGGVTILRQLPNRDEREAQMSEVKAQSEIGPTVFGDGEPRLAEPGDPGYRSTEQVEQSAAVRPGDPGRADVEAAAAETGAAPAGDAAPASSDGGDTEQTKAELLERAREFDIAGRSSMDREQLAAAVADAEQAQSSSSGEGAGA